MPIEKKEGEEKDTLSGNSWVESLTKDSEKMMGCFISKYHTYTRAGKASPILDTTYYKRGYTVVGGDTLAKACTILKNKNKTNLL